MSVGFHDSGMVILALHAKKGSGKTTVADVVARMVYCDPRFRLVRVSFATILKEAASTLFDIPLDKFYHDKAYYDPRWGLTVRQIMERFGTDAMQGTFGRDFWARRLELSIAKRRRSGALDFALIDDLRTPSEFAWVNVKGGFSARIVPCFPGYSPTQDGGDETADSESHELPCTVTVDHHDAEATARGLVSELLLQYGLAPLEGG